MQVAGTLRLDLAQYRELQAFAQFGSDLDAATQAQLARGERLVEILKQKQYAPLAAELQVVSILAVNLGLTDSLELPQLGDFEEGLHQYLVSKHDDLLAVIRDTGKLEDELREKLKDAMSTYLAEFEAGLQAGVIGSNGSGTLENAESSSAQSAV